MFHHLIDSHDSLFHDPSLFPNQDTIFADSFLESPTINNRLVENTKKRQRRSSSSGEHKNGQRATESYKIRKIVHRDVERHRRREMASLYASLRSLLPLEYIKGKRSVSDHMHEAVNYIKHLETKSRELKMRRDELINLPNFSSTIRSSNYQNVNTYENCVKVSLCGDGVEVLITISGFKGEEGFPFSSVMAELLGTGLNVISCVCSKANGKFLYKIQSQENDLAYIDLPALQQKVATLINFS